jgi:hypothetical protein
MNDDRTTDKVAQSDGLVDCFSEGPVASFATSFSVIVNCDGR